MSGFWGRGDVEWWLMGSGLLWDGGNVLKSKIEVTVSQAVNLPNTTDLGTLRWFLVYYELHLSFFEREISESEALGFTDEATEAPRGSRLHRCECELWTVDALDSLFPALVSQPAEGCPRSSRAVNTAGSGPGTEG